MEATNDVLVIFFATLQAGTWASLKRLSHELLSQGWKVTMACPEALLSQVVSGCAAINLGTLPTGLPDLFLHVGSKSGRRVLWRRLCGANSFDYWSAWVTTFLHLDLQGVHNHLASVKSAIVTDQFHAPMLAYAFARKYDTKLFVHESGGGFWHGCIPRTVPLHMIPPHFNRRTGIWHHLLAHLHKIILVDEHRAFHKACDTCCEMLVNMGLFDGADDVCLGLTKWWNLDVDYYLPRRHTFFRDWKSLPYAADIEQRYITIVTGLQCVYQDNVPLPNVHVFGSLQASAISALQEQSLVSWLGYDDRPIILAAFGRMSPPRLEAVVLFIKACLKSNVRLCLGTSVALDGGLVSTPDLYHAPVIPQRELLTSGRMKIFATHAGLSSCQEALLAAVPMLFLPMQMDQFDNASRLAAHGCGKGLAGRESVENMSECIMWLLDRDNYLACKSICLQLSQKLGHAGDAKAVCEFISAKV